VLKYEYCLKKEIRENRHYIEGKIKNENFKKNSKLQGEKS